MIIGSILSNPKYHDAMTGKLGAKAAERAAKQQIRALEGSIDYTEDLSDAYDPYSEAGLSAWNALVEGATLDGLESNLSDIYGSGVFAQQQEMAQDALQNQLASTGMRRSGAGLLDAANQPFQTAMSIENMLRGRNQGISDTGYNALNTQTGLGQSISQMMTDIGKVKAGGTLGVAQSHAQGASNQYNALHNVGSSIMGMFGGGGSGGDSNVGAATTNIGVSDANYFGNTSQLGGGNTGNWNAQPQQQYQQPNFMGGTVQAGGNMNYQGGYQPYAFNPYSGQPEADQFALKSVYGNSSGL